MTDSDRLPKLLYTSDDAAEALGVSTKTLLAMVRRGEIRYVLLGKRRRFSLTDLQKFIEDNSRTAYMLKPGLSRGLSRRSGETVDIEEIRAKRLAEKRHRKNNAND